MKIEAISLQPISSRFSTQVELGLLWSAVMRHGSLFFPYATPIMITVPWMLTRMVPLITGEGTYKRDAELCEAKRSRSLAPLQARKAAPSDADRATCSPRCSRALYGLPKPIIL